MNQADAQRQRGQLFESVRNEGNVSFSCAAPDDFIEPPSANNQHLPRKRTTELNPITSLKQANMSKRVTRTRKAVALPKAAMTPLEQFRFPPMTPKSTRTLGWRPGSGFEGVTLDMPQNSRASFSRPQRKNILRTCIHPNRTLKMLARRRPTKGDKLQRSRSTAEQAPQTRSPNQSNNQYQQHPRAGDVAQSRAGFHKPRSIILDPDHAVRVFQTRVAHTPSLVINTPTPTKNIQLQRKERDHGRALLASAQADPSSVRKPSRSEREGWLKRKIHNASDHFPTNNTHCNPSPERDCGGTGQEATDQEHSERLVHERTTGTLSVGNAHVPSHRISHHHSINLPSEASQICSNPSGKEIECSCKREEMLKHHIKINRPHQDLSTPTQNMHRPNNHASRPANLSMAPT